MVAVAPEESAWVGAAAAAPEGSVLARVVAAAPEKSARARVVAAAPEPAGARAAAAEEAAASRAARRPVRHYRYGISVGIVFDMPTVWDRPVPPVARILDVFAGGRG